MKRNECPTCRKIAHDFAKEEALNCVPPPSVLQFGSYTIDSQYRAELYKTHPYFTTEEIVGSFLGHNPHWPSQEKWLAGSDEEYE